MSEFVTNPPVVAPNDRFEHLPGYFPILDFKYYESNCFMSQLLLFCSRNVWLLASFQSIMGSESLPGYYLLILKSNCFHVIVIVLLGSESAVTLNYVPPDI